MPVFRVVLLGNPKFPRSSEGIEPAHMTIQVLPKEHVGATIISFVLLIFEVSNAKELLVN